MTRRPTGLLGAGSTYGLGSASTPAGGDFGGTAGAALTGGGFELLRLGTFALQGCAPTFALQGAGQGIGALRCLALACGASGGALKGTPTAYFGGVRFKRALALAAAPESFSELPLVSASESASVSLIRGCGGMSLTLTTMVLQVGHDLSGSV